MNEFHIWPWLLAIAAAFFICAYAILSSGCATTAPADAIVKCPEVPPIPQDAGMPATIDQVDPWWAVDGGH